MAIIYENLDSVIETDRSVIPAHCLSFAEQSLYVAESAEETFNTLFENVGIEELAVYESTGDKVIYEGAKMDAFKAQAKAAFQKLLSVIKAAYENILKWFEDRRKEAVSKLTNIKKTDLDGLDPEKDFGKTHTFENLDSIAFKANASNVRKELMDEINKKNAEEKDQIRSKFEPLIISTISGVEATEIKDMKTKLREKLLGEEVKVDKAWLTKNLDALTGVVYSGTTKNLIKSSFNDEKKAIDEAIGEVKKFDDSLMEFAQVAVSLLKSISTCLNSCMGIKMDVCKRRYGEYRNILVKVLRATGKIKPQNESAVATSQRDLVESAFDWK